MRRRSGGIHSNSEEEYIELADIAQQCKSLFYDEPKMSHGNKRRKYAFSVNTSKSDSELQAKKQEKPVRLNKAFESFNFDQQSYSFAKDCQELTKIQQKAKKTTKKKNFAILSQQNACQLTAILETILGIKQEIPEGPQRAINLCVHRFVAPQTGEMYIDCYWVIDKNHFGNFESLFKVYIQKSSQVLDIDPSDPIKNDPDQLRKYCADAVKGLVDKIHGPRASEVVSKQL